MANGLSPPVKSSNKQANKRPVYILPTETHFRWKNIWRLKVRGWRNICHSNGYEKKAGVAILISDKIDVKTNTVTRDKEGHYHH